MSETIFCLNPRHCLVHNTDRPHTIMGSLVAGRSNLSRDDLHAHALIADDDLWRATEATAKHNGESVAATVRRALAEYLIEKGWSE